MSGFTAWLRRFIAGEPALIAWLGSGGLVSLLGFVFHLSHAQMGAAVVILSGVATIWTAAWAHPPEFALATGALTTIAAAMGTFGFHPPAHVVALAGALLSVVIAALHRQNLSPWLPPKLIGGGQTAEVTSRADSPR